MNSTKISKKFATSNGEVILLQGKIDGIFVWRYIEVEKLKIPLFLKAVEGGENITPKDFGKVIYFGEGVSPPPEIEDKVKKEFWH